LTRHKLILFDIDGTLMLADGAGREAMRSALEKVYGTADGIDAYRFAGKCDRATVFGLMRAAGLPEATIQRGLEAVADEMALVLSRLSAANPARFRACPGALELVSALDQHPLSLVGLVTGNFRVTAFAKLACAGFEPGHFGPGAYGDESEDRNDLPPLAISRARALTGETFTGRDVIIIGDTVDDVRCGMAVGALTIAVLTGYEDPTALRNSGPDFLLPDLTDLDSLLRLIHAE
jgi:phosphoglycolate phosphatase-like HAD superfamily hydrolase